MIVVVFMEMNTKIILVPHETYILFKNVPYLNSFEYKLTH